MTCKITIQTVGDKFVLDMNIDDKGQQSHTAWKTDAETTLEDVLGALPEMYLRQRLKRIQ